MLDGLLKDIIDVVCYFTCESAREVCHIMGLNNLVQAQFESSCDTAIDNIVESCKAVDGPEVGFLPWVLSVFGDQYNGTLYLVTCHKPFLKHVVNGLDPRNSLTYSRSLLQPLFLYRLEYNSWNFFRT